MARPLGKGEKPLDWVGSSKKEFLSFPARVKDAMGAALGVAQFGGRRPAAKPWKGVFEVVEDHVGDTCRAVYTGPLPRSRVRAARVSEEAAERRPDCDDRRRTHRRLKFALADHEADMAKRIPSRDTSGDTISRSTGNVFADLGYADAEERQTKLRLALAINDILASKRLTQSEAAALLGVGQPKISALARYRLEGFSVERLITFLTALDRDVEIKIKKKPRVRATGRVLVIAA